MSDDNRRNKRFVHLERKRQRQHRQVMDEEQLPDLSAFKDHPLIPYGKAEWIDSLDDFRSILAHIAEAGSFAFDTEFISELSYHSRLCLIQVATPDRIALIDPLAKLPLEEFWELIADPGIEKIVHAGQQDLEPVPRLLNKEPANIFDTQIAAGMVGLPWPLALNKLILAEVGAETSKGPAFTDWTVRPLNPVQYYYAANDVRFLPAIRSRLGQQLKTLNREDWLREECEVLTRMDNYLISDDQIAFRVKGSGNLRSGAWVILKHLALFRDRLARERNHPPRSLIRDENLLDLARRPPKNSEDLGQQSLPRGFVKSHGAELLKCLETARADKTTEKPEGARLEEKTRERQQVDNLLALAQCWCLGQQVSPALCFTRQQMLKFLRSTHKGSENSDLQKGWRGSFLGHPLVELMAGRLSCRLSWHKKSLQLKPEAGAIEN